MKCEFEVKPFYAEYCKDCMLNGCYPWNRNPFLLCTHMGGILPGIEFFEEDISMQCLNYKKVTEEIWQGHLQDLKKMAELNEECRLRAMIGKTYSSELLPAEEVLHNRKDVNPNTN